MTGLGIGCSRFKQVCSTNWTLVAFGQQAGALLEVQHPPALSYSVVVSWSLPDCHGLAALWQCIKAPWQRVALVDALFGE